MLGNSIEALIPQHLRRRHAWLIKNYNKSPTARAMGLGRNLMGLKKNGQEIPIEVGLSPIAIRQDEYILVSVLDISDRKRADELEKSNHLLKLAATHDSLTGLPNRNLFMEISENLRHLSIRKGGRLTVMFVDLDGFKAVNDQYGHDIGDQVLCEVAAVLRKDVRKSDIVSRIGGDEFLLCLSELHDISGVVKISDNLLRAISAIRNINGYPIKLSASIGAAIAVMPDRITLDEIIRLSDRLMYKAKKAGKGKAVIDEYTVLPVTTNNAFDNPSA